ncbi:MAG: DNA methyltransferase [Thermodesulfobacteriota bacterium]
MAKNVKRQGGPGYELTYPGKEAQEDILARAANAEAPEPVKTFGPRRARGRNMLISGDNLSALGALVKMKRAGRLKNSDSTPGARLVYIDPPFSTNLEFHGRKKQKAYRDKLVGAEFIEFLRKRLVLLRELLSSDGSIFVHLDWKKAHPVKTIMDEVFGEENFLNDIVWSYGGRGAKAIAGQFSRNHDIILWYRKEKHVFNQIFVERRVKKGEGGFRQDAEGRWFKTSPRGDYTERSIAELRKAGRVHETRNGKIRIKYFLREDGDYVIEDRLVGDVWDDIPDAMHIRGAEKTGYPTQKPEALLARIISAASNEGDLVLDAFAGAGTALAAAEKLGRRWIGIDSGALAIHTIEKRLLTMYAPSQGQKKGRAKRCSPFTLYITGDKDDGCGHAHARAPEVECGYSIDEQTQECVIKVERFSSPGAKAAGPKGLDALSSVMIDFNFDHRAFHLDRACFAEELRERDYTIRFPLDKVKGEVMLIYTDISGNESWFAGEIS